MLRFAQLEGARRGGHTWWALVAGEGPAKEDVANRAAARPIVAAREERVREKGKVKT